MSARRLGAKPIARPWLRPLVPLYGAVTGLKRAMARWGLMRQRWLAGPVISVGSVSAGGAGKTPVVLLLAEVLKRRGYGVRILTRGYGRESDAVERVDVGGDAGRFGDEPMLLAQRSGAPVFVGADRYEAGLLAETVPAGNSIVVHVLDDGFQHRKLGRDIDVVLLTREDTEDVLLPAGNLRESLTALRDADVIVLREEEMAWTDAFVAKLMEGMESPLIWIVRRRLSFGDERLPKKVVAFSGIARPDGFVEMLKAERCGVVETVAFGDHHAYGEQDVARLVEVAKAAGAEGFVTTEKDAVKLSGPLGGELRRRLEAVGPVAVARLMVELVDERDVVDRMLARVRAVERRRAMKVWR
jgi:tetraacyldisaccharide 4'-kinase